MQIFDLCYDVMELEQKHKSIRSDMLKIFKGTAVRFLIGKEKARRWKLKLTVEIGKIETKETINSNEISMIPDDACMVSELVDKSVKFVKEDSRNWLLENGFDPNDYYFKKIDAKAWFIQ